MYKKVVHQNIIYLEKDKVSVIRHREERLEYVKMDGETEFPILPDFWDWWKKINGYVTSDSVDFCFLYDKEYSILQDDFLESVSKVESSERVWNMEYVRNFFGKMKPTYASVCLIDQEGQEWFFDENGFKNKIRKTFFTNLCFETDKLAQLYKHDKENAGEESAKRILDESEISPIARYFMDLRREEQCRNT